MFEMEGISDILTFFQFFISMFIGFLRNIIITPGVSFFSLLIVGLFIGLTISMFVRSGKT